ncbi:hypothetical protein OG978_32600 [Streptomyces sp. NBC_01591]|uniref:hypothetical protein n=1 Tax=Streptomyces sp. NBC_01591 TaxID=2975888 RepID=UPI002DD8AE0E|nr:hypothetical protein [Streptomyces sp. NBC_01591]WSD71714.1 hypothetical protein OG978_32600 [Streptomyces sp. NBC_01591]
MARDIAIARQVRPLVGWTQREGLRRLAYALRPLIDRGLEAHDIAAELQGMALGWRPARPAAFITAALEAETRADTARAAAQHEAVASVPNVAWQQWLQTRETPGEAVRTDDDRRHARLYGWDRWQEIAAHYDEDPDDALDLYGTRLCSYAVGRAARESAFT